MLDAFSAAQPPLLEEQRLDVQGDHAGSIESDTFLLIYTPDSAQAVSVKNSQVPSLRSNWAWDMLQLFGQDV